MAGGITGTGVEWGGLAAAPFPCMSYIHIQAVQGQGSRSINYCKRLDTSPRYTFIRMLVPSLFTTCFSPKLLISGLRELSSISNDLTPGLALFFMRCNYREGMSNKCLMRAKREGRDADIQFSFSVSVRTLCIALFIWLLLFPFSFSSEVQLT